MMPLQKNITEDRRQETEDRIKIEKVRIQNAEVGINIHIAALFLFV